jgi:hypothetical protein
LVDRLLEVKLIIHNQFPGIELVSPMYYINGATCYLSPAQRVDVDSTTQAGFDIGLTQDKSTGVLIYKLQRRNADEFNEETCIRIVIIWEVHRSGKFSVASLIVEHNKSHVWDEDKSLQLIKHRDLFGMQYDLTEETYLMREHTVLMTRMSIIRKEEYYELEMTITEGSINEDTQRLRYIDMNK